MIVIRPLMRFVNAVIAFGLAVLVLVWALDLINIEHIKQFISQLNDKGARTIVISSFTILLIGNFLCFSALLRIGRYDSHIRTTAGESEFSVSVSAVEEALENAINTLPEIYDVKLKVYKKKWSKKPALIKAKCSVWDQLYSKTLHEKIKAVVHQRFHEIIESETAPNYEVYVAKFVKEADRAKKDDKKEDVRQLPFRGPEWPVELD